MTQNSGSLQTELDSMRQELARVAHEGGGAAAPPAVAMAPELESLLRELQDKFKDASENAEEFVKEHPIAALSAAFLVGVAVGRLMGKD